MCASKSVYFQRIYAFLKVYRFACAHFIVCDFQCKDLDSPTKSQETRGMTIVLKNQLLDAIASLDWGYESK